MKNDHNLGEWLWNEEKWKLGMALLFLFVGVPYWVYHDISDNMQKSTSEEKPMNTVQGIDLCYK